MLDKGELVAGVSMDLSKAFDVIDHDLLLAKLKACGVGERSFVLFKDYLSGRQHKSRLGTSFPIGKELLEGVCKEVSWGQCFLIFSSTTCFTG